MYNPVFIPFCLENTSAAPERFREVDVSSFEPNTPGGKKSRCFYLVKEGGAAEGISMIKCLGEIERKVRGLLEARY